jgi:superfamily I DNA and/or RNA helicase
MPTCEAVGTIARGENIVVVGDPNQLPPTNFFTTSTFDEENTDMEDLESILDDCLALSLPSKHLIWHYRSRHESLISFSNSKYYDNKLLTFPSPDDLQSRIKYQYVKGLYDRGGSRQNKEEAKAVVEEIKKRLEDPHLSGKSIGVVTFNSNQQSLIEDLLNSMFIKNPDLEKVAMQLHEPIFIKNLENVQGDERDVILFSIGYGADKDGKVTMNFGPLNRDGGWRRLNVAVSRARYEMKVFSTLTSDQIDLNRTAAEGVAGLKDFLEYVEKGRLVNKNGYDSENRDGFVENVAMELRKMGYEVRTNIGNSGYKVDIGIVNPYNPTSYLMAVICDGYNYSASRCSKDREIIQMDVLRNLGWDVYRLWIMDWWTMKDATLKKLTSTIDEKVLSSKKII